MTRVLRFHRWHKTAAALGGVMMVAAGCGASVDAVVVMSPAPAPQVLPAAQDVVAVLPTAEPTLPPASAPAVAAPEATLPPTTVATTVAPAPAPAPEVTTPPTTAAPAIPTQRMEPIPPLAEPLVPVKPGDSGPAVAALQARLMQIGFWLPGVTGEYDFLTSQAVMAYQKDFYLERTGVADQQTVDLMTQTKIRVMSKATSGDLMEVNKAKQLLYLVRDGRVVWAVNTSTGSGKRYTEINKNTGKPISGVSITEDGLHEVYRQHENGWRNGDLGQIYRPKYFKGGAAIHGAPKIPGYPASHGCVRVTTAFMDAIWANDWMPMGSKVWVHDGSDDVVPPDLSYMYPPKSAVAA